MKVAAHLMIASLMFAVAQGTESNTTAQRLKIGVVQMALDQTVEENCSRITAGISNVAARGVRVAVFPEGALRGEGNDKPALVNDAVNRIRHAAQEQNIYVLFGGATRSSKTGKETYWMSALGPDGNDVFHYDKLFDKHDAKMPGIFRIDGVPCSAFLCADRWLRGVEEIPIQEGAQISFELSCNFASEWVAPFEWYWNAPRAMRNNVWVIFANTGNARAGLPNDPAAPRELRHGHSAVIAPDGRITAASSNDVKTMVITEIDVNEATRAEASARAVNPVLRKFWETGIQLHRGDKVEAPKFTPLKSPETDITIAVAQTTNDPARMIAMIGQARASNADLVVFPERAIDETALKQFQDAARQNNITVLVGTEHRVGDAWRNSAFAIGPDGSMLTRYDQLSAIAPFQPGTNPATMWFRVKGVPAVVTIGRDALWTELAELAAVAGAQIHIHLDHDGSMGQASELRRLQLWSNVASFHTFTATANVIGSAIWDDLRDLDERRAEVRGLPRPRTGDVEVYSPFSANLIVHAGDGRELIIATRRVNRMNPHYPARTSNINPQMDAWYRLGASLIQPR